MRVVLLPGLHGSGELFHPLVAQLGRSLQADIVSYPRDLATYSELLPIARASLPKNDRFIIVGESFSGPLAALSAAEHPAGLAGVVFGASFVRCPVSAFVAFFRQIIRGPIVRAVPWSITARALLGRRASQGPLAGDLRQATMAVRPSVLAARVRAVLLVDVVAALDVFEIPVLYIAGSRDMVVSASSAALIGRHVPNTRVITIDAPHLVFQVAPADAAKAIAEFASSASAL